MPETLVYRLDAGEARFVDLDALASLCQVLRCTPHEILVWQHDKPVSPVPERLEQEAISCAERVTDGTLRHPLL